MFGWFGLIWYLYGYLSAFKSEFILQKSKASTLTLITPCKTFPIPSWHSSDNLQISNDPQKLQGTFQEHPRYLSAVIQLYHLLHAWSIRKRSYLLSLAPVTVYSVLNYHANNIPQCNMANHPHTADNIIIQILEDRNVNRDIIQNRYYDKI